MEPVEPNVLIDALCAPWERPSPAAVSAVDVLLSDAIENEDRPRPADGIVTLFDGRYGFRPDDLAHWTMRWPHGPGFLVGLFGSSERAIGARLGRDAGEAAARLAAFRSMREALGEMPWDDIADMEVVSIAMGHYGPSRTPAAWGVTTPWLHATAAGIAAKTFGRAALAAAAAPVTASYDRAMREIARDSSAAIAELGRRAAIKGTEGDPFSRPIRSYLPILGGTLH